MREGNKGKWCRVRHWRQNQQNERQNEPIKKTLKETDKNVNKYQENERKKDGEKGMYYAAERKEKNKRG